MCASPMSSGATSQHRGTTTRTTVTKDPNPVDGGAPSEDRNTINCLEGTKAAQRMRSSPSCAVRPDLSAARHAQTASNAFEPWPVKRAAMLAVKKPSITDGGRKSPGLPPPMAFAVGYFFTGAQPQPHALGGADLGSFSPLSAITVASLLSYLQGRPIPGPGRDLPAYERPCFPILSTSSPIQRQGAGEAGQLSS